MDLTDNIVQITAATEKAPIDVAYYADTYEGYLKNAEGGIDSMIARLNPRSQEYPKLKAEWEAKRKELHVTQRNIEKIINGPGYVQFPKEFFYLPKSLPQLMKEMSKTYNLKWKAKNRDPNNEYLFILDRGDHWTITITFEQALEEIP